MTLPRTRETPTQGEASGDSILAAHKQNESEQQVGLVSFTTDLGRMQMLSAGLIAQRSPGSLMDLALRTARHAPKSHTLPKSILNSNFKTWGHIFKKTDNDTGIPNGKYKHMGYSVSSISIEKQNKTK